MCFSSIFSLKLRIIPYLCEIDVRTPTSFWSSEKFIKFEPGVKTYIKCSRMNSSIIWYPLLYRTTPIFSKNGDWSTSLWGLRIVNTYYFYAQNSSTHIFFAGHQMEEDPSVPYSRLDNEETQKPSGEKEGGDKGFEITPGQVRIPASDSVSFFLLKISKRTKHCLGCIWYNVWSLLIKFIRLITTVEFTRWLENMNSKTLYRF